MKGFFKKANRTFIFQKRISIIKIYFKGKQIVRCNYCLKVLITSYFWTLRQHSLLAQEKKALSTTTTNVVSGNHLIASPRNPCNKISFLHLTIFSAKATLSIYRDREIIQLIFHCDLLFHHSEKCCTLTKQLNF